MAFLDRIKLENSELVSTDADLMTVYALVQKYWTDYPLPNPETESDRIEHEDSAIKVFADGAERGRKVEVWLNVAKVDDGVEIWSAIEYPSSKFWWTVCIVGIPFGFGLGLLGVFWVLDTMAEKPKEPLQRFEKVVEFVRGKLNTK